MSPSRTATALRPRQAAPLFAALGDETRLCLVRRLGNEGTLSLSQLAEGLPITRQAVRKHLQALQAVRLVRSEVRGREHLWTLEPSRFELARCYLERISGEWDDALARLRRFVEE